MTGGYNGKQETEIRAAKRALSLFVAIIAVLLVCGKFIAGTPHQLQTTRIVIATGACVFAIICAVKWKITRAFLRSALFAKDSATNVAIFRIISFSTIWWLLYHEPIFGSFECQEIWRVPLGIGWLFKLFPPQGLVVKDLWYVAQVLCAFGILGIFTRASALLLALLSIYIFGVPECLQVRHIHHIVWASMLLSIAHSSDKLSIPAALGLRSGLPERSVQSGITLRSLWLMFGVIYFFPGFMKLWNIGIDWIWSDNLKNIILFRLSKLAANSGIFERIPGDLPWEIFALIAVIFEVCFFLLVLNGERIRLALLAVAIVFHNLNEFFIRVGFTALQTYLYTLVNWYRVFLPLGRRLFVRRLLVHVDPSCSACRVAESSIRSFDLLRRVSLTHQSGIIGSFHEANHGGDVLRKLCARAMLASPFLLVAGLFGGIISKASEQSTHGIVPAEKPWALLTVSAMLIGVNAAFGFARSEDSWPFASYPCFDYRSDAIVTTYSAEVRQKSGTGPIIWLSYSNPLLRHTQISTVLRFQNGESPEERQKIFLVLCRNAYNHSREWKETNEVVAVDVFKNRFQRSAGDLAGKLIEKEKVCVFANDEWRR